MGLCSYAVAKVAGDDPETFVLIFLNHKSSSGEPEMQWSKFMSEVQMQDRLRGMFQDDAHIEQLMKKARENPR